MKWLQSVVALACVLFVAGFAFAEEHAASTFAPFEQWKTAVASGDQAALANLYSTNPPLRVVVDKAEIPNATDELRFWASLKPANVTNFNPKVLSLETRDNQTRLVLRIQAVSGNQNIVAGGSQIWLRQLDGWHIVLEQRSSFHVDAGRSLPEPAKPNPSLYPDPAEARADLKTALAKAAREKKRVLVVFGGNWCYDCHVLDATFHSRAFAPLVQNDYVVLHINIGDEGKENNDLAASMGVNLDHGVPSLAVLDPDGKVVVAQQNGEFEATEKIGPHDVHAFLEKWKPVRSAGTAKQGG